MSDYLGRLVERAVGPPAAAARPRLAPVFPLGRAAGETPPADEEPVPVGLEDAPAPERAVARAAAPAAPRVPQTPKRGPAPAPDVVERPPPNTPPEREQQAEVPQAAAVAHAAEPPERPADVTPRTAGLDVEPRPRAAEPVAVELRPERGHRAHVLRKVPEPQRAPSIEVRIGRVEVRPPPEPEPVEWDSQPVVQQPGGTGFGELAASRRYVDRGWRP